MSPGSERRSIWRSDDANSWKNKSVHRVVILKT
jgi:hypothetical protein